MAIYYCPLCKQKIAVDNIEEVHDIISCSMCGSSITPKQLVENLPKIQNITSKETNISSQSDKNIYDNSNNVIKDTGGDAYLIIQKKQLEELGSIKNMLKFFTILTVISLIWSFVSILIVLV